MELKNFFAQDTAGNTIPSPTVYVYQPNTVTLVTGLKDKNGANLANPFTGTAQGLVQFAAPDGEYDLRVTGAGRDFTIRIQCLDASDVVTDAEAARDAAVAAQSSAEDAAAAAAASAAALADLGLADMNDVDFTPAPTDGQLLKFNATSGKWEPYTLPSVDPDTVYKDTNQTFSAAQRGAIVALVDGATITPDMNAGNFFSVTLGGNRTLANPTNITPGQSGSIFITQDGTGNRTLAYGSYWDFAGGTAPTLSTVAGAVDRLDYVVRTTTSIHAVLTKAWS